MTRKIFHVFLASLAAIILCASPARAQNSVGVGGGYAYLHEEDLSVTNGWFAAFDADINNWLGIAAEVNGHYKTLNDVVDVDTRLHVFGVGPRISSHQNRSVTPYAEILFGRAQSSATASNGGTFSDGKFMLQPAGGVDIMATPGIDLRLQIAETIISGDSGGDSSHEFQFMAGIIFRFNRR